MKRYFFIVAVFAAALAFCVCSFSPVSLIFPGHEYEDAYDGIVFVIISGEGEGEEISAAYRNAEADINEKLNIFLEKCESDSYREEIKKQIENRILFKDLSRKENGKYLVQVSVMIPKNSAPRATI